MSKPKLKKLLEQFDKDELLKFVLEMYGHSSHVKSYLDGLIDPEEAGKKELPKYQKLIRKEFNVESMRAGLSFARAKKAIKDFKEICHDPRLVGTLMMDLAEGAAEFTNAFGDMNEGYYSSAYNSFEAALTYLKQHNLLLEFRSRAERCVSLSRAIGWGYGDGMGYLFNDFYPS